jgi:hypothetical protein
MRTIERAINADWKAVSRNLSLAAAVFLLPFQRAVYTYTPEPELLQSVYPAFSSVYVKVGDIALVLAIGLFLLTDPRRFFKFPRRLLFLIIPTLLLAGLALLSLPQARLPLLTWMLFSRLIMMVGLAIIVSQSDARWVIWPLIAAAVVNAALGSVQYAVRGPAGLSALGEADFLIGETPGVAVIKAEGIFYLRAIGFTVHPNILAPYLVTGLILLLTLMMRGYLDESWAGSLAFGVILIGLFLTYSRAAWIGAGIAGIVLIGGYAARPDTRQRLAVLRYPLVIGGLILALFVITQSRQIAARFGFSGSEYSDTASVDRLLLLDDARALFTPHPWRGVGGYNFAVEAERSRTVTDEYSENFYWQPVHNFTALVATELGIAGGVVWLFLTFAPWVMAFTVARTKRLDAMALTWLGLSAFLAWNGLFDHFAWSQPEGMGLMWITWASLWASLERCANRETDAAISASPAAKQLSLSGETSASAADLTLLGININRAALRSVLSAFVLTRFIILFLIFFASMVLPLADQGTALPAPAFPNNAPLSGLIRWDSYWFVSIVSDGYSVASPDFATTSNVAFLPLYPLLVKFVTLFTGNLFSAGLIVSNLAFLVALGYLYALARREFDEDTAARTVFYLAAAPTAIIFSAFYAESTLLALIVATFYHAGQAQWGHAWLAGTLAAATRPLGLLAIPVILLEGAHLYNIHLTPASGSQTSWADHLRQQVRVMAEHWPFVAAAMFVPVGLLAYIAYLGFAFDVPFGFIQSHAAWGRDISGLGILRLWTNTITELQAGQNTVAGGINPIILLDILSAVIFLPLTVAVAFKMRPAYAVFTVLAFIAPLNYGTFWSMTRYLLMLVPCYMLLGTWGRRTWVDRLVLGTFLPMMGYCTILFSRWYWIG